MKPGSMSRLGSDGEITFDTVEGQGTRVEVALPTLATKQEGTV